MIAATNINLKVPFNEKDQAKSLGARWNAETKLWYAPQGVDAAPFEKWVSSALNSAPNPASAQASVASMKCNEIEGYYKTLIPPCFIKAAH